jgi:hypothetical protein
VDGIPERCRALELFGIVFAEHRQNVNANDGVAQREMGAPTAPASLVLPALLHIAALHQGFVAIVICVLRFAYNMS